MGELCDTGHSFDTGGAFYEEGTAGVKTLSLCTFPVISAPVSVALGHGPVCSSRKKLEACCGLHSNPTFSS